MGSGVGVEVVVVGGLEEAQSQPIFAVGVFGP